MVTVRAAPALTHLALHLERLSLLLGDADEVESRAEAAVADVQQALSRCEVEHANDLATLPLVALAERFGLSEHERDIVLLAAAPALSAEWRARAEQLGRYGKIDVGVAVDYLQRRGLAEADALALLVPGAPLRLHGLIDVYALGRVDQSQLLSHRLQCPSRVSHWLQGRRELDEVLVPFARLVEPSSALSEHEVRHVAPLVDVLTRWRVEAAHQRREHRGRALALQVRGPSGVGKTELARRVASRVACATLEFDCGLLTAYERDAAIRAVHSALRAAELLDLVVVFDRVEELGATGPLVAALRDGLDRIVAPAFLMTSAELPESTGLSWRCQVEVQLRDPEVAERELLWRDLLQVRNRAADVEEGMLASQYPMNVAQIRNAVDLATLQTNPGELDQKRLEEASSGQMRADLGAFARQRATNLTFDDLVLPPKELDAVKEIISACRQRAAVLHRWGFRKRLDYGTGIVALFSGDPGTGKTLCARVVAESVGLTLYQIAIPTVVSKWIGETERNISQIFQRAKASQAILLFDEADSLLAARTEVKDATDRYANMSTNQLLQEIEAYEGVVILTTNLEQNLDAAAERRILFRVHFPFPGVDERRELWNRLLPAEARDPGTTIDFEELAELYELSGGHIKNAIMRGAYAAMDRGRSIDTEVLGEAAEKECRAIGKLVRGGW